MSPETDPAHILFETTPNPRARKVVLDCEIRIGPPISYRRQNGPRGAGPLIEALLNTEYINDLYIKGQTLTVTQDGAGSWFLLEEQISQLINAHLPQHDPSYTPPEPVIHQNSIRAREGASPQLQVIREILDATITPYIASHGGALNLVNFDTETHRLTVSYEGACGSCPSSLGMTLAAIQNMLRDQFDTQTVVDVLPPEDPGFNDELRTDGRPLEN